MSRFSKSALVAHLERDIASLQCAHRFDPSNGWAQVDGLGEEINRRYGEFQAMCALLERIENGDI